MVMRYVELIENLGSGLFDGRFRFLYGRFRAVA